MKTRFGRWQVLGISCGMLCLAILVQVFGARQVDAGGMQGPGPGSGSGAGGTCTEPCWHNTNLSSVTDLAVQRVPTCCVADRVAALLSGTGVGIYRSLDGGKTYSLAKSLPSGTTTYNLAATKCLNNNCGDFYNRGPVYAATSVGLYKSNSNTQFDGSEDLANWVQITTPKNAQNKTLPVTFVGSVIRSGGDEEIFITVDPANVTYGGFYKRNASGGWDKVVPILNVVAISPDCGIGARTFAVTRPCTGCAGGSLWISSGSQGASGTWSALPNGLMSGPKSSGFNDIATHCYGSPGRILMTNADATLPVGRAVHRAPVTLTTWDDVTYHDVSGTGGLIDRIRAGNIRWPGIYGGSDPGTTAPIDHLHVGGLGSTVDGRTSGVYTGPAITINWQPWYSLNNAPLNALKWVQATDGTQNLVIVAPESPGETFWHFDFGTF